MRNAPKVKDKCLSYECKCLITADIIILCKLFKLIVGILYFLLFKLYYLTYYLTYYIILYNIIL